MHATFDFVSIRVCCMSWPHCSMHISTIARKRCRIVRRKRGREIGVWRLPQLMVILCHMFVCSGACLASERWFYSTLSEPHQNRLACTYFLDLITICCHIYQLHIQKKYIYYLWSIVLARLWKSSSFGSELSPSFFVTIFRLQLVCLHCFVAWPCRIWR